MPGQARPPRIERMRPRGGWLGLGLLGVVRVGQVGLEVVAQAPLRRVAPLRAVRHVAAVLRRGDPVEVGAEDLVRVRVRVRVRVGVGVRARVWVRVRVRIRVRVRVRIRLGLC